MITPTIFQFQLVRHLSAACPASSKQPEPHSCEVLPQVSTAVFADICRVPLASAHPNCTTTCAAFSGVGARSVAEYRQPGFWSCHSVPEGNSWPTLDVKLQLPLVTVSVAIILHISSTQLMYAVPPEESENSIGRATARSDVSAVGWNVSWSQSPAAVVLGRLRRRCSVGRSTRRSLCRKHSPR